jgi:hypothetical protein
MRLAASRTMERMVVLDVARTFVRHRDRLFRVGPAYHRGAGDGHSRSTVAVAKAITQATQAP